MMKTWQTKSGHRIVRVLTGRSNVFLLTNGKKNILIDTSPEFMRKLLQKRLNKLNINHIDYLILTHSHFDHANNAAWIKEKFNALVIIHREEASFLTSGEMTIPGGTNFITRMMVHLLAKSLSDAFKCSPCEYDLLVDDQFDLSNIGFNAFILHTPGHSPGSVSVVVDNELAVVGDCMFGVFPGTVFPPFADDAGQVVQSWGRLLETGCRVFLPSHGSGNNRLLVQRDFDKRKPSSNSYPTG